VKILVVAKYLNPGSPPDTELFQPIGLAPEKCYWSGMDEEPFGTREDYRGALRDIDGDSPFTHPPLKIIKV